MTVFSEQSDASAVVQRQLDAYNARDIERFIACWREDAMMIGFPDQVLAEGAEAIRERHLTRFAEPNLYGRLISRMELGNMVIDREAVTRTFPEGVGTVDVIVIYEVVDGLIARAWYRMGTPLIEEV